MILDRGKEKTLVHTEGAQDVFYRETEGQIAVIRGLELQEALSPRRVEYHINSVAGEMSLRDRLTSGKIPTPSAGALREILKRHGLTGSAAAAILGVDGRPIGK